MPKSAQPWVATLVRIVFDQPDTDAVEAQFTRVLDVIPEKVGDVVQHIDDARADLLALTAFRANSGAWSRRTTRTAIQNSAAR